MKVAIIGYGYVGQATHKMLGKVDYILDVNSTEDEWSKIVNTNIAFICVPTPKNIDGTCDTSIVQSVINRLRNTFQYTGTICIRSTIPWGAFNDTSLVAAPEFLSQNSFLYSSNVQLLGGTYNAMLPVIKLYEKRGVNYKATTWDNAWQVKYASNLYGALKILFWEMIQDITGNERLVYDTLKSLNVEQGDMAQVGLDGYRGLGGACFPKDLSAIASMTKHPLLQALLEYDGNLHEKKV